MKIATYLLGALLAAAIGAAALFYITTFQPMMADYQRMQAGMPELDKAKNDLMKYRAKEAQETAWIGPAVAALNSDLASEIKEGKAEVTSAGNDVIINIREDELYTPKSKTFSKDSQLRTKLAAMLNRNELKGKEILIGNVTEAVAAYGKGRKRVPAKDALTLASERSAELVKYLVKNNVSQEAVAALAYSAKVPDVGFKIKTKKAMIIIGAYPAPAMQKQVTVPAAPAKPAAASQPPAAAPAAGVQPKTIPFRPAPPKTR
jgi:hypothetical protein